MSLWGLSSFVLRRLIMAAAALGVQAYLLWRLRILLQGARFRKIRLGATWVFALINLPFLLILVDWAAGWHLPGALYRTVVIPFTVWQVSCVPVAVVFGAGQLVPWAATRLRRVTSKGSKPREPEGDQGVDLTRRNILLGAAATAGVGTLAAACHGIGLGAGFPKVVTKRFPIKGLSSSLDNFRIAHITDIHTGYFYRAPRLRRLAKLVMALKPDRVAVTGDMVHGFDRRFVHELAEGFSGLEAPFGIMAVLGNHDHRAGGPYVKRILEQAGWEVLHNRHVHLHWRGGSLAVAGVDDWPRHPDLDGALRSRADGVPTVLLSHRPEVFRAAARKGIDLVLAGHTHGGQVAVGPFNLLGYHTRYLHGSFRSGRTRMYVSAGVGITGPPIRLGVDPELTLVVLRAA
jgi:predicted MPP superfamily phosphohydrolase